MDTTENEPVGDAGYHDEPFLSARDTSEHSPVDAWMARAGDPSAASAAPIDLTGDDEDAGEADADTGHDDHLPFRRRRPKTFAALCVLSVVVVILGFTWVKAMTKPGTESFMAKNVQWMRDLHLGFIVDRVEQTYYENNQPPDGGTPTQAIGPAETTVVPTSEGGEDGEATTTVAQRDHTTPPAKMATPAPDPLPNEGEWFPAGPLVDGLPAVYTTKVRPNAQKTSLLIFVAWIDPKLTTIKLHPGIDLPGGEWNTPNQIDPCNKVIMASNGGFRMDQARGGYYAEGREPFKLVNGGASLIFKKDGTVDVAEWGRDYNASNLGDFESVRQNLELLVDDGQPVPNIDQKDWGALLKNVYFVWRSGYGVTKDGALIYVGGPALQPRDLANALINAGAVRGMEGDINPEWVTANLYSVNPDGSCSGKKGLDGPESEGGMRAPADRYLSTETRDFVAVYTKP